MENVFELFARGGVGENPASKFLAAQPAIGLENALTEHLLNLRQRRLPGLNYLAGQLIGIDDRNALGA